MKSLAALAVLAVAAPQAAQAATGNLNGTYTLRYTTLCQSIENEVFTTVGGGTDQDQQTDIETINEGKISQTIALIQFKPSTTGALSGTFTARFVQSNGTLAILGMPGGSPPSSAAPDMTLTTDTQNRTGAYSVTLSTGLGPSSFTLTPTGQSAITFSAYVSQLRTSTYYHFDFINIDGNPGQAPSCTNSGSGDHM